MTTDTHTKQFLGRLAKEHQAADNLRAATNEYFRFARRDRRTKAFLPAHRSYDAAIFESWDLMTRRVRDQVANNGLFRRAVQVLTDMAIGPGMLTFANPFGPTLTADEDEIEALLSYAMESDHLYEEWAEDPEQFDVAGKLSAYDMHAVAFSECATVGDAILLRCRRRGQNRLTPLCYQILEREQLDCSRDRPATRGSNKIVNGIELDQFGRAIRYWIYDAHPYDHQTHAGASYKSSPVPASRVLHLYLFHRPSQSVGISWLHAMAQTAFDRDKYLGTELQSAAKAALLMVAAKLQNPEKASLGFEDDFSDDYTGGTDGYGNPEMALGADPVAVQMKTDESVEVIEPGGRPNSNAEPFIEMLDHDLAAAAGLSFHRLTGKTKGASYSNLRQAVLDDDQHVKPLQNWFGRGLALKIRRQFNREAAASLLTTITPAEFERRERQLQRFDAVGAGREFLDPREIDGTVTRLRAGVSTLQEVCGSRQRHWIRVIRQKALENKVAARYGVVLDYSKGQGGQVESTTSDTSEQEEPSA